MKDLSTSTRRMMELARHADDPPAGAMARVERSLVRRAALGTAVAGGGATLAKTAVGAGLFATAGKSALVVGVTATLAVTGWQMARAPEATAPAPVARTAVSSPRAHGRAAVEARVPALEQQPAAAPAPTEGEPPVVSLPAATTTPKARERSAYRSFQSSAPKTPVSPEAPANSSVRDPLALEAGELRVAQRALRDGNAGQALELLEDQERRHASGALQQERRAARVLALCEAGQSALARQEATRFARDFPTSPLVAKLRGACPEPTP